MEKNRVFWLMLGLAILIIIFGFVTVLNPSGFWGLMNILLGISLIFSGISAIISAFNNQKAPLVSLLFIIGFLILILGIVLICSSEANFIGRLMIWMFALWAFIRGCMLIFFGIQNKESNGFWWAISLLGVLLVILAIVTAISSGSAANLVGICIGLSIIFDGISLLFFAFRFKNNPSIQEELISQSNQSEIAQGNVVITVSTESSTNADQSTTPTAQVSQSDKTEG